MTRSQAFSELEVRDGKNIFQWHDLWHPNGILFQTYGYRVVYDVASHLEEKFACVLKEKQWVWQADRSEQLVDIQSKLAQPDSVEG